MSSHYTNVTPLGATVRVLAGIPLTIAGPVLATRLADDWSPVTIPMLFVIGGTLVITGLLRLDPMVELFRKA